MQGTKTSPVLREFLRDVRPNLPLRESADILLELETTLLDRADDLARGAGREPTDDDVRHAVLEMGDPESIAASYAEPRLLVAPEAFRSFLMRAGMLFVVHMVLIGIVTALDRPFHVGLFPIDPVGPNGLVSIVAAAVHAGLLDLGLMAAVYGACGAFQSFEARGRESFAVQVGLRTAGGRAVLATLAVLVLTLYRDGLFVVVSAGKTYPLFTTWTTEIVPLLAALLAGSALKELAYVLFKERRLTVALDALHGLAGVVVMLYLLGGDPLMAVPQIDGLEAWREPVNVFLAQLGSLVLAMVALIFGAKALRRSIRIAQI